MRASWWLVSLVGLSCATPPPPRISFEDAAREGRTAKPAASVSLGTSLERFAVGSNVRRSAVAPGARMPNEHAQAWDAVLDDTEAFLSARRTAEWVRTAMQARMRLEAELQADAHTFGDVPGPLAERVTTTLRRLSVLIARAAPKERLVDPRRFLWPVDPVVVSSPYGERTHPIVGGSRFHAGIDLEAPISQPVLAAEAGVVVFAGWNGAHGNQIEVRHDPHWTTRYSHLDGALVKEGMVVRRGQAIGLVGETGLATGPHLHFELRRDGDALDPETFLRIPGAPTPLVSMGALP